MLYHKSYGNACKGGRGNAKFCIDYSQPYIPIGDGSKKRGLEEWCQGSVNNRQASMGALEEVTQRK
jgi:hypothetical protein